MLSCHFLKPVSLTAYPLPLWPLLDLTGTGPAWWVVSELLTEQRRAGMHLQNSG